MALARLRLGQILTAKKQYAEADGLLTLAADNLSKERGPADTYTKNAIKARVELYQAWGKLAQAQAQQALLADDAAKKAAK